MMVPSSGIEASEFPQEVSPEGHVRPPQVLDSRPPVSVEVGSDLAVVGDCGDGFAVPEFVVWTKHGPTDRANLFATLELREECLDPSLDRAGVLVTERDHLGLYLRESDVPGPWQPVFRHHAVDDRQFLPEGVDCLLVGSRARVCDYYRHFPGLCGQMFQAGLQQFGCIQRRNDDADLMTHTNPDLGKPKISCVGEHNHIRFGKTP